MLDLLRDPEVQPADPPEVGRRLDVCVVTETFHPEVNGVTLTLGHLVDGLRARGHHVSLVRPRQPRVDSVADQGDGDVTLVRGLAMPGYAAVRLGLPAGPLLRERWHRRGAGAAPGAGGPRSRSGRGPRGGGRPPGGPADSGCRS